MKPLLRRCLQFIPVFFGITLLSFGLLYIAPSDPVSIRLTEDGTAANPEVVARMRAEMGLDEPFLVQYGTWLMHFVQGDMGKSYITDIPVAKTFSSALPYTLRMAGIAMLLTLLVSLPLGISIAALRGSRFDYGIRLLTFVTNAMPNFVIAIVLMYIFSFKLGLIPVLATTKPIGMILPSATLAIVMSSRYIRQIRAAALDELDKDYIVGLRARGIPERQILFGNVLKNIMVIVITLTGISVGSLHGHCRNDLQLAGHRASHHDGDQQPRLSYRAGNGGMDGARILLRESSRRSLLPLFQSKNRGSITPCAYQ